MMKRITNSTILHFVVDSGYTDNFITYVESNFREKKHKYYLISNDDIRFIRKNEGKVNRISGSKTEIYKKVNDVLKKFRNGLILLHYLDDYKLFVVRLAHRSNVLYWVLWGADFYNRIPYEVYDDNTKSLINYKKRKLLNILKIKIKNVIINRIDYVGTTKYELDIVRRYFKIKPAKHFLVYPIGIDAEDFGRVGRYDHAAYSGKRVLIGNSGDPTNNHYSIMQKLALFKDAEIVVPLSYGDADYIRKIIECGTLFFGERFHPLTEYMDETKYERILSHVDVAVFNHFRQQAVGNIRILVRHGKKIYLNPRSVLYKNYRAIGMTIGNIEDCMFNDSFFTPLSNEQKEMNRQAMQRFLGRDRIQENMSQLFSAVYENEL